VVDSAGQDKWYGNADASHGAHAAATAQRLSDLRRFYVLMDQLALHPGGPRRLADCSGRMDWPMRGVYFFMELGEMRRESDDGPRIVHVGTHALKDQSRTTLWKRLSQHKGQRDGNGNHRGSIFRLLIGAALLADNPTLCSTWGQGNNAHSGCPWFRGSGLRAVRVRREKAGSEKYERERSEWKPAFR
jgi:hypothetical protein